MGKRKKGRNSFKGNTKVNASITEQEIEGLESVDLGDEPELVDLDVNDEDSFDDAFLDALESLPDEEEGDDEGEPVAEMSDEEKYGMDMPVDGDKDDPDEEAEIRKVKEKIKESNTTCVKAEGKMDKWVAVIGILFLVALVVSAVAYNIRNKKAADAAASACMPLAPIEALQSAPDDGFIGVTGLKAVTSPQRTTAALLHWVNPAVSPEEIREADFSTRMQVAFSSAYVEVLCENGFAFIDSDYGVMMLVPITDAYINAEKNPDADTVIWFGDLWTEGIAMQPVNVKASQAVKAVRSADGLGEFLKAAEKADNSTLYVNQNQLINTYGVSVNAATEIPAVLDWGEKTGVNTSAWTVYLTGMGSAATGGASIFNYVLELDDASPAIEVYDAEGNPAGESRKMSLFEIYGVYDFTEKSLVFPEGLDSFEVTNAEAAEWSTSVTEEEWVQLYRDLEGIFNTVYVSSGVGGAASGTESGTAVDAPAGETGLDSEEGVSSDGEGEEVDNN